MYIHTYYMVAGIGLYTTELLILKGYNYNNYGC